MNLKRISAILLALLLMLCLVPATFADVIFEPRDSFYEKHREDMRYADKVYIAQEKANGYESPEDDDVMLTASDGTRLYISHVYTDENGEEWGIYDWDTTTCWFRLSDLEPVYDTRDFINDHKHEFTDYNDQLADLPLDGGEMPLWKYPGSEDQYGSVYLDEYFTHADYASFVYTDAEGRNWVYFPYVFGMEGWANADDPLNPDPVVFDANAPAQEPKATPAPTEAPAAESTAQPLPSEEPIPTEEPAAPVSSASRLSTIVLIVIAVLAVGFVVVLSVVLIIVFFVLSKNKKK